MPIVTLVGAATDLTAAIYEQDVEALDRMWDRTHTDIRRVIARLPLAGSTGSILQATAVAHSVYRLQRERQVERSGRLFKDSDLTFAFRCEGMDYSAERPETIGTTDEQAIRIFSRVVRNEARTYLADKRRRQQSHGQLPEHVVSKGSENEIILLSLIMDFMESAQKQGVPADVLEAFELDIVYGLEPVAIAEQLGKDEEVAMDLLERGRVVFKAWQRGT